MGAGEPYQSRSPQGETGAAESPSARAGGRVLFLAFYFPPLGGAGVQRAVKFTRYLPEFGWEPTIVTGPGGQRTRYAPLDASLAADLPSETRIFRVDQELPDEGPDPLRRRLGLPTRFAREWPRRCEATALQAASGTDFDVILATLSPFETTRAAERVAATLGVPWVADLRDPWALDEVMVYPTRWHRMLELRRMRRRLETASLVIMNTPEAARALREAFPELADRTLSITNGFDREDFEGSPPPRRDDRFRIVHTGKLHVRSGSAHRRRRRLRRWLGGERVRIDLLTRSHVFLLRALERWQREHPQEVAKVELCLAGEISAADAAVVARSSVADRVRMPGYLEHGESVALLTSADLLFLPLHGLPAGERARVVPGKTYEYLAARRPILAAVPEGDARDYVLASGLGDACAPDDVNAMVRLLRLRFAERQAGREPVAAPASFYRQFERREITARLARALGSAVARPRHARGGR